MWSYYEVELRLTGRLMGGIPKHPDLIKAWLEARKPSEAAFARMENPTPIGTLAEQVAEQVEAEAIEANKVWVGFKHDKEKGLYVDSYHLKSHLKDAASVLRGYADIRNFKAKFSERVFMSDEPIYLSKDKPDGFWEHPVHVMTLQGPRSALKRNDYVEGVTLQARFRVLADKVITEDTLQQMFEYGSVCGFGAERGLGNGRYTFTLTKQEEA